MCDEHKAAGATGASAHAGYASRRSSHPLGVGRSGGVDGTHADGAVFARQGLYSLASAHAAARQSARR
jgi:hypothetical protein